MCPQQYSTILALLFQTEVFTQWDESERLHTSFDLMHVSDCRGTNSTLKYRIPEGSKKSNAIDYMTQLEPICKF